MTEDIYKGPDGKSKVPKAIEGQLFHYTVTGYEHCPKDGHLYTVMYKNKMIHVDGVSWVHNNGDFEKIPKVSLETADKEVVEERKLAAKPMKKPATKPTKKPGNKKKNESTKERRERKEKERKEKEMVSEQHV
jgi:hypothetical protein